jgi:hypothetical protein
MLPQIALEVLPRMADFALWVAACETGLWEEGIFEAAYAENRESVVETVLEANPVATAVEGFLEQAGDWEGTATDLLADLNRRDYQNSVKRDRQYWPQTPRLLSGQLRRIAPLLRKSGLTAEFRRTGKTGERTITLKGRPRSGPEQAEIPF